ncbi:MAG: ABC transporter permease [Anaerolineae bacterium]|jgi:ABC-type transport system involved in multi-copper enzyme maturation permease subunit|nr:ABC transporter permease [Anaerolineae bacterium]
MVANAELQRVGLLGWRTGLGVLLRKENRAWWAPRHWVVQGIVWSVIVNGLLAAMLFGLPAVVRLLGQASIDAIPIGLDSLFKMGGVALAVGAIILAQDAIIGERQLGVTEWLLSKPVSRPAYLLSKMAAHGLGVLVIFVALQGALAYGQLSLALGKPYPLPAYLVGVAGLAVHTFLYLASTLMLGVLTTNRGVVLGASLGVLLTGWLVVPLGAAVSTPMMLTPWTLLHILPAAVQGVPLPVSIWLPLGVTVFLSAVCGAVALARFRRMEF